MFWRSNTRVDTLRFSKFNNDFFDILFIFRCPEPNERTVPQNSSKNLCVFVLDSRTPLVGFLTADWSEGAFGGVVAGGC